MYEKAYEEIKLLKMQNLLVKNTLKNLFRPTIYRKVVNQ